MPMRLRTTRRLLAVAALAVVVATDVGTARLGGSSNKPERPLSVEDACDAW
jgi:hypothetical protein